MTLQVFSTTASAAQLNAVSRQAVNVCTSSTRPASPDTGMVIYETDTGYDMQYSGSVWVQVGHVGAWATWTPTLSQSGAVTKTVTRAAYTKLGRLVVAHFALAITGSGTANNAITVSLPVTAKDTNCVGGSFYYFRAGNVIYTGAVVANSTTVAQFYSDQSIDVFGKSPNFAVAGSDSITATVMYEASA